MKKSTEIQQNMLYFLYFCHYNIPTAIPAGDSGLYYFSLAPHCLERGYLIQETMNYGK